MVAVRPAHSYWAGLDGVLVLYSLFFCKCLGGQLIRKRRHNRPAGIAAPYLKPRPVLGDDVCAHALSMARTKPRPKRDRLQTIQSSKTDPLRWFIPQSKPLTRQSGRRASPNISTP